MSHLKKQEIDQIRIPERPFTIQNQAFCFLPGDRSPGDSAGKGLLADTQVFLKRFGRLYYFLLRIFAPVMGSIACQSKLKSLLVRHDETKIIVNLGSGPTFLGNRTIHDIILMLLMVLTAPIKLADILLVHFPDAEKIDSGFVINGKK